MSWPVVCHKNEMKCMSAVCLSKNNLISKEVSEIKVGGKDAGGAVTGLLVVSRSRTQTTAGEV